MRFEVLYLKSFKLEQQVMVILILIVIVRLIVLVQTDL